VSPELRAWVKSVTGPIRAWEDRSWPHGVTQVLRVTAGADVAWVKVHREARKRDAEVRAYRELVPHLVGVRVPTLIATNERALLLSDVPGERPRDDDPAVHRAAGEALAALHAVPLADDDPVPIRAALQARFARWAEEARALGASALVDAAALAFGDGLDAPRVWCHRDYHARNWLVDGGRLGLIDFERAGPDLALMDVVKLAEVAFEHPGVEDAFYDGYGRPVDAEALRRVLALTELATVVWARKHGDPDYEAVGRRTLARYGITG
jgi:aminoglycoside phosphotransferase (APT) family kinase protein